MAKRIWTRYKGETLNDEAMAFLKLGKSEDYANWDFCWTDAYYKGKDPEKATEWFITCDDGGWYKVDALYMTWFRGPERESDNVVAICNWKTSTLNATLKALRHDQEPPRDPWYQT